MPPTGERSIEVRRPRFAFDAGDVPRFWFDGRPGVSMFLDALGLIFPEGERFFIRSVNHYIKRIDDDVLARQVRAFMTQEGQHGAMHDAFNRTLRAQGLDMARFSAFFARVCNPPRWFRVDALCLAITVAVEHFTAVIGRMTLDRAALAPAHPELRRLYEWHALEELEHKSVAFDVLRAVHPSYFVRITGYVLVLTFWPLFVAVPLVVLMAKAGRLFSPRAWWDFVSWGFLRERLILRFMLGLVGYFAPRFHPDHQDESAILAAHRPRFEAVVSG